MWMWISKEWLILIVCFYQRFIKVIVIYRWARSILKYCICHFRLFSFFRTLYNTLQSHSVNHFKVLKRITFLFGMISWKLTSCCQHSYCLNISFLSLKLTFYLLKFSTVTRTYRAAWHCMNSSGTRIFCTNMLRIFF